MSAATWALERALSFSESASAATCCVVNATIWEEPRPPNWVVFNPASAMVLKAAKPAGEMAAICVEVRFASCEDVAAPHSVAVKLLMVDVLKLASWAAVSPDKDADIFTPLKLGPKPIPFRQVIGQIWFKFRECGYKEGSTAEK